MVPDTRLLCHSHTTFTSREEHALTNTGVVSFIALHLPLLRAENCFIHKVGVACQDRMPLNATWTSFGKNNKYIQAFCLKIEFISAMRRWMLLRISGFLISDTTKRKYTCSQAQGNSTKQVWVLWLDLYLGLLTERDKGVSWHHFQLLWGTLHRVLHGEMARTRERQDKTSHRPWLGGHQGHRVVVHGHPFISNSLDQLCPLYDQVVVMLLKVQKFPNLDSLYHIIVFGLC